MQDPKETYGDAEGVVSMPVPVGALPVVTAALDRYYKGKADNAGGLERVVVPKNGEWTEAEIKQLVEAFRNPAGRAIVRRIAEAADGPVNYGELAEAGGVTFDQLRAQLAWLAKYAKKIKGENVWPITVTEDASKVKGERYVYRMPKRIAEWWLGAEQEAAR